MSRPVEFDASVPEIEDPLADGAPLRPPLQFRLKTLFWAIAILGLILAFGPLGAMLVALLLLTLVWIKRALLRPVQFSLRTLFFITALAAIDGWVLALLKPALHAEPGGYFAMIFFCIVVAYLGYVARFIAMVIVERTQVRCYAIKMPIRSEYSERTAESG